MWTCLESKKNDGIKIDMASSFYVGDAAGRIVNWAPGKKKDFSSADRLLALNLKLRFSTPEEHFSQTPLAKYALPPFNPSALDEGAPLSDGAIISKTKEVLLMVGSPGSGKSHFVLRHLVPAGYTHVNRDTLGSWQKCVLSMEAALSAGRSVVVDNTNPDRDSRKRFIQRVPSSVPCRCFLLTTTIEHIRHNNRFRELTDKNHIPVNDMIINSYKNKFEAPSLEEGFSEIVKINFVPSFSDPELKELYQMYLLEK